jgi:4-alpha-glucanotransferase
MNKKIRYCGVLLHPSSLPGPHGVGDLGDEARDFINFLAASKIGIWQILPLGPVGFGNSPYAARSAFAGNELLINLNQLVIEGLLGFEDVLQHPPFPEGTVEFSAVEAFKKPLLHKAARQFHLVVDSDEKELFNAFCSENDDWLDDYALYMAILDHYQDSRWFSVWEQGLTAREAETMERWRKAKAQDILLYKTLQYLFFKQWRSLKAYANEHGVLLVGDIPIFVAPDSVDAWSNRKYLKIDAEGHSTAISGVPPDAFSDTGQLWGNPVYDWDALEKDGFSWWVRRMEMAFVLTDIVRIDHFRGFDAYWEVPAGESTAENGVWVSAPGVELFDTLQNRLGKLPVFAEDLGVITDSVENLRDSYGFPGMKVAQFGFNLIAPGLVDAQNDYLPHNYDYNCVAYTGTHDNNTTRGWYDTLDEQHRDIIRRYLQCPDHEVVSQLIRSILASHAKYAIFPMQDFLGLGSEARMNTPGTCGDPNWCWRMKQDSFSPALSESLASIIRMFGRTGNAFDPIS